MQIDFADDMRQAMVVTKNEIKKFLRGKKILLFGALLALILALEIAVPFLLGDGYGSKEEMLSGILGNLSLLVMLAGVLFSATSIVSEFEERTALILFTRPIRKWSVYMGKLLASIITIGVMMLAYYVVTVIATFVTQGGVVSSVGLSIGMCFCAIFAMAGLSLLFSSIAKKASTASIMTLVMVLLVFSIIGGLMKNYGDIDNWWVLSSLMGDISGCIGHTVIDSVDPFISHFVVGSETAGRSAAGLLVWGLVTNVAAYFLFKRREF